MKLDESMPVWGRFLFLFFALLFLTPIFFIGEMGVVSNIFLLVLQLAIVPLLLYHSLWRKVIHLDNESQRITVFYGLIFPVFKRRYLPSDFNEFKVETSTSTYTSNAESADSVSTQITQSLSLTGKHDLKLVEYSYCSSDIGRKNIISRKHDDILSLILDIIPDVEIG